MADAMMSAFGETLEAASSPRQFLQFGQTLFRGPTAHLRNSVDLYQRMLPDYHAREHQRIFRRAWLPIASTHEIPEQDGYILVDLPTFRTSLLVTRDGDGRVRAFHNICRHRGNRVAVQPRGSAKRFSCGFHGWTFASNGELVGVTDADQFVGLDREKLGLPAVAVEVWETFVFVNFETTPHCSLREWLGDLHDRYGGYFNDRERVNSYRIEVDCNWHIAINAFTEGYHNLFVHGDTVPGYQGGKANPNRHRSYIELTERHGLYSARGNSARKPSPAEVVAYGQGRKLYPAFDEPRASMPPGLNPGRQPDWAYDLVELFPNFVMLTGAHWHSFFQFWPLGPERTLIVRDGYAFKARTAGERFSQRFWSARSRDVVREDLGLMASVQRMMMSGTMTEIVLSQQELLLQHHFAVADAMMAER